MNRNLSIVSGIILAVIITFIGSVLYFSGRLPLSFPKLSNTQSTKPYSQPTIFADVTIPQPIDASKYKNIATPVLVQELATENKNKVLGFNLSIANNTYSSNKILANEGDIIRITLTSLDNKADFTLPALGIKREAARRESKRIEFQAVSAGNFQFFCESCLPEDDNSKGLLMVVAKS